MLPRLDKDSEIIVMCLLLKWFPSDALKMAAEDMLFEFVHGGIGSKQKTHTLKMINAEEAKRNVEGISSWRRCLYLAQVLTAVVAEGRFAEHKTDGARLLATLTADGVSEKKAQ